MTIPCEECVTLAVCKHRKIISCIFIDDYSFMHDHDPGDRGATARAEYIASFLFGSKHNHSILIDRRLRTVTLRLERKNETTM